jgi:hypothetical protein
VRTGRACERAEGAPFLCALCDLFFLCVDLWGYALPVRIANGAKLIAQHYRGSAKRSGYELLNASEMRNVPPPDSRNFHALMRAMRH